MSKRRVVVTGLGIVSPVGSKITTAWENITAGKSGINVISPDLFDTSEFSVKIAGNVTGFDVNEYINLNKQGLAPEQIISQLSGITL